MYSLSLNDVATMLGLMLAVAGFTLGVMNYLRDKPRVVVKLTWDMSFTENSVYDPDKLYAIITVSNVGRRPIFVSHACLRLPKGCEHSHLVLTDGISGDKLCEGDPPKNYVSNQEDMENYASDWKDVYAEVTDSTGKRWRSYYSKTDSKPSWAESQNKQ